MVANIYATIELTIKEESESEANIIDMQSLGQLDSLYLDGKYNMDTLQFESMVDTTATKHSNDLRQFVLALSGNDDASKKCTSFANVHLVLFNENEKENERKGQTKPNTKKTKQRRHAWASSAGHTSSAGRLFHEYGITLNRMLRRMEKFKHKLHTLMHQLFMGQKGIIRIRSKLSIRKLYQIVKRLRSIITELYLASDRDYEKSAQLYEAIVETQIFESTIRQLRTLDEMDDMDV